MSNEALLAQRREMRQEIEQLTRERDAALADLSQARAEQDEAMAGRDTLKANLHDTEAMYMRLSDTSRAVAVNLENERDAAIARAEAAEAQGEAMRVEIAQLTESGVAMVDRWDEERKAHARTRHERDALREEVARLKGFHDCPKDADCETQWEVEKLKAKLGRTVAALQECGATIYASTDSYEELWRRAEIARTAIADSAAAGEAWRGDPPGTFAWLVEDVSPTGSVADTHQWPNWSPLYWCGNGWTHDPFGAIRFARKEDAQRVADLNKQSWPMKRVEAREHGFAPIAAVDARRGGDDDQSGPLRSVAELIAATENPPPVPPEIWRRGGK